MWVGYPIALAWWAHATATAPRLEGVAGVIQDSGGAEVLTCYASGCRGTPAAEPGETLTCRTRSDASVYVAAFVCGASITS